MNELIDSKLSEIVALRRLDVFGSATTANFDAAAGDVAVLVEFDRDADFDYFEA